MEALERVPAAPSLWAMCAVRVSTEPEWPLLTSVAQGMILGDMVSWIEADLDLERWFDFWSGNLRVVAKEAVRMHDAWGVER